MGAAILLSTSESIEYCNMLDAILKKAAILLSTSESRLS